MPAAWNRHDERQFKAILSSCKTGRKRRSTKTCKRIAGATVNKRRRLEGRTLSGLRGLSLGSRSLLALGAIGLTGVLIAQAVRKDAIEIAKQLPSPL